MTEEQFLSDLTEEQRIATKKFDEDVSVTANAGSGKTTLLVRKYLYLQLFYPEKYNHKNIVAITFTNKAASEIRKKTRDTIYDLLQKKSQHYDISDKFIDFNITDKQRIILTEINKNITNLEVGTIHQFCRRLIKNFAFRIGYQPNFTSLDENEKSLLLRKLILQTLATYDSGLAIHSSIAVSFLGFNRAIDYVKQLIYKNGYLLAHEDFFSKSSNEINELLLENFRQEYKKPIFNVLDEIYEKADEVETASSDQVTEIRTAIAAYKALYNDKSISLVKLSHELELIRKIKGGRSFFSNNDVFNISKNVLLTFVKKLILINDLYNKPNPLLENRVSVGLALTKIAQEVYKVYDEINRKENRIDNDSTIDLTVKLLHDKVVNSIVQSDLAYLMIDEFQDTDDRQLKIANLIRQGGKVNLFVVGDDKQGIYRFRNADVRVFKRLRGDLREENRLQLKTSFRSNIYLNSFINDLFSPFMDSKISEYDVEYQEIVSANIVKADDIKHINFLFYNKVGQTNTEDSDVGSAEQLIKTLHYLLVEKNTSPNDICILSNSGNDFVKFTPILEKFGLDYVILSGKGFYRKNEVKDLISFIQFIDDPENDLLCAATLKSSLFNYTDQDLYDITKKYNSKRTLWKNYKKFVKKCKDDYHTSAVNVLKESIYLSNKLPLSNILIKIIDDSNWNYFYHDDKNKDKVFRNLYKFMGILRALENKEYGGLAQTFDLLNDKFEANKESEEVGDISDSIRISSIHSVKGLEFKHVILFEFDMFSLPGVSDKSYIDEAFGSNIRIPSSITNYNDFGVAESLIDLLIKDRGDKAAYAEVLRVAYVAATRAKQSLHIIHQNSKSGEKIKKLKNIFGEFNETGNFAKEAMIKVYDTQSKTTREQLVSYTIHSDFEKSRVNDFKFNLKSNSKAEEVEKKEYTDEIPALERCINFNATKLSMFERGDYKDFEEVYIFGMPLLENSYKNYDTSEDKLESNKTTDGTDYGILFHALMENFESIIDNNENIDEEHLKSTINEACKEYKIDSNDLTSQKLEKDLKSLLKSDFISNNKEILIKSVKEFDLKMAFGDHILKAVFDAIYFEGSTAEIWDWKTNKFNEYDTIEKKAESYILQMDLYAFFAFRYNTNVEKVNSRLFFVQKAESSKSDQDWIFTKTYIKDDIDRIKNKLADLIGEIKNQYPNTYPVSPVL